VRAPSPDAGKAQEIAAIRDGDVIGIGHRADRVEDRAGMNFAVGADRLRGGPESQLNTILPFEIHSRWPKCGARLQ
jgi:hypothetical protein